MEADQLLQQIKQMLDDRFTPVEQQLIELKSGQTKIQSDIDLIKTDIRQTKLIIDEDIRKSINGVVDGHQMLADKMMRIDTLAEDMEEIKGAIVAVEAVVVKNRANIIDLQNAKSN